MNALDVARIVEIGEAEAYADMFAAASLDTTRELGLRVERIGSAVALVAERLDVTLFNRVVGLGVVEPADDSTIETAIAVYRDLDLHHAAIQLSPAARPSTLSVALERHGLRRTDDWVKVFRDTSPPPPVATDLNVGEIGPDRAGSFADVTCRAFEMPTSLAPWLAALVGRSGWHTYVACDHEEVVAAASLFVRGDVGWMGIDGTLSSHRRRGAQRALMARRMSDAARFGCRWLVTETGEDTTDHPNPSLHNMLRTGFQIAYSRPNFVIPTTSPHGRR